MKPKSHMSPGKLPKLRYGFIRRETLRSTSDAYTVHRGCRGLRMSAWHIDELATSTCYVVRAKNLDFSSFNASRHCLYHWHCWAESGQDSLTPPSQSTRIICFLNTSAWTSSLVADNREFAREEFFVHSSHGTSMTCQLCSGPRACCIEGRIPYHRVRNSYFKK